MHPLDEAERATLEVLLADFPAYLADAEMAVALGDSTVAEDALAGLLGHGLVHRPREHFASATRVAHYLYRLSEGAARLVFDLVTDPPVVPVTFRELVCASGGFTCDVADGLHELGRRGVVHRAEDVFWTTRAARRMMHLDCVGVFVDPDRT